MTDQTHALPERALAFATNAHAGQVRKYDGAPYISHPIEVAEIVGTVTDDPVAIAAAFLHDVVEDCDVSVERIRDEFGADTAQVVWHLTGISTKADGNRKTRVAIDRGHYAKGCARAQTVKVADIISNLSTIVERDPDFARTYLAEKHHLLAVLTRAHPTLLARAHAIITCSVAELRARGLDVDL